MHAWPHYFPVLLLVIISIVRFPFYITGCTFVEHHVDEREAKKNVQQLRRLKRILQLVIVL
jgi:hypothetical protein